MTLYDSNGFFVPNSAHVYLINNRSNVHYNADGSLDIYIQPTAPATAAPATQLAPVAGGQGVPADHAALPSRSTSPGSSAARPGSRRTVLPCLANGKTADGVACAS